MIKAILIAGLPCSGKTFLAKQLSEELDLILIDDPKNIDIYNYISNLIDNNQGFVISDPNFIFSNIRNKLNNFLKGFNINIEWIYFENNPEQCLKNIPLRNDGRKVEQFIKSFSKQYIIPDNSIVRKVYRKDENI